MATSANLNNPTEVTLDGFGNIYIADYSNHRIRKITASTGVISTIAGNGTRSYSGDGSAATLANLNSPTGIDLDGSGNIYITDAGNNRIRKVTTSTGVISTIAGNGTIGYGGDGSAATSASLNGSNGIAVDDSGNIYIADRLNDRIRKVTKSTGIISTVAGNGIAGYGGDGSVATSANLNSPAGVAVDASGNIYIADLDNYRIRKVTVSTGIISTVAGNGSLGSLGDGGAATSAKLINSWGVAVDGSGNIYIAANDRIRKVTVSTGIINTVAGNGIEGYGGDGSAATLAKLDFPRGVAVDASGNIYIADYSNNRIRKVTASTGIISTVAGNGIPGYGGDSSTATSAKIYGPTGVAVDGSGNIYIADEFNKRIRKVSASTGVISTVAGNGIDGESGDGSAATAANVGYPSGVTLDGSGNLYILQTSRIRLVNYSIVNNIISNSQTICAGSAPLSLTGSTPIGSTGSNTYTWLRSTISATAGFTAIPSTNTINYSPGALTQNTWFRRYVVSGALTDTSAAVAITVNNAIANNTITFTTQTICSGSIPATIAATTATGGNGTTYNYKWLKSTTSAITGFANAGGNDSIQNFTSGALTQNTWFKRRVSSGVCNADTTAALMVAVNTPIATNTITSAAQNICLGSLPTAITATIATGGNGATYTYKWLKSTTSATTGFANAGGNDSIQNFTSGALTQNTWFRRRVSSGVCIADTTAALLLMVNPIPATSNITGLTNVARLDTASYSVNGLSGSVFNWVATKGLVQTGASTNQIKVKWNVSGMDTLKVIETSNQGCVGSQKTLLVNIGPATGINEINTSNSILVYPNPFNETIFISLLNNSGLNKAILYDLLGKEVLTTHISEIDVKELKSGVYLIMVIDDNGGSYSQKLIKN